MPRSVGALVLAALSWSLACDPFRAPVLPGDPCSEASATHACTVDLGGRCSLGERRCLASPDGEGRVWSACLSRNRSAETCNGEDDDCDGRTDEKPATDEAPLCEPLEHAASTACEKGQCVVGRCSAKFDNCDENDRNGCEQRIVDELDHCGGCDQGCTWRCGGVACDEVESLALGSRFACALLDDGEVSCWGSNAQGQLGAETADNISAETVVPLSKFARDVRQLVAGDQHTCVVLDRREPLGRVACWGSNAFQQLGYEGPSTMNAILVEAVGKSVKSMAAGGGHSCALTEGGYADCWGSNQRGQVDGRPSPEPRAPTRQPLVASLKRLAAGASHTCAVSANGSVLCWGDNTHGQSGIAATYSHADGSRVVERSAGRILSDVVQVAAGSAHTCALTAKGDVYCWGLNGVGQLGHVTSRHQTLATEVSGLSDVVQLSLDGNLSCARTKSGAVFCWGSDNYGQLGRGKRFTASIPDATRFEGAPSQVVGLTGVDEIGAGSEFACARQRADRAVLCWGRNADGELGSQKNFGITNGVPGASPTPQRVMSPGDLSNL